MSCRGCRGRRCTRAGSSGSPASGTASSPLLCPTRVVPLSSAFPAASDGHLGRPGSESVSCRLKPSRTTSFVLSLSLCDYEQCKCRLSLVVTTLIYVIRKSFQGEIIDKGVGIRGVL